MIILKIGGSILTKKESSKSEINKENLKRITKEIKRSLEFSSKDLIIIHGAGSFGHPPAKKYKIGEKFDEKELPNKRIGFSKTQIAVKKLNTIICNEFAENNIPVVSIQPSSFITMNDGRIDDCNLELIKKYLDKGFVPVLYGDVVLDKKLEIAVLSGDQIIQYLAMNLKSDMIILGTDVDGVYNKNPKNHKEAIFFDKVSSLEDLDLFEGSTSVDVTGGMVGKIKELLTLADVGINSKIINANKKDYIFKALEDQKIKGTLISKK